MKASYRSVVAIADNASVLACLVVMVLTWRTAPLPSPSVKRVVANRTAVPLSDNLRVECVYRQTVVSFLAVRLSKGFRKRLGMGRNPSVMPPLLVRSH